MFHLHFACTVLKNVPKVKAPSLVPFLDVQPGAVTLPISCADVAKVAYLALCFQPPAKYTLPLEWLL